MDAAELTFPLVPRRRPVGSPFGRLRAARRGLGSSVVGTRPYHPGDDPSLIDWKLSARLSSVRGEVEFMIRETFADEAPRSVVVVDRRPSMELYPPELPWLSKPGAVRNVWRAVSATTLRELGLAGYLDLAGGDGWFPPRSAAAVHDVDERFESAAFDAPTDGLERAFAQLARARRSLPAGTFVFVCSDFAVPPAPEWWLRGLGYRWDLVPVVVQDPVWEQSFPLIDRLVVPFADPVDGRKTRVRITIADSQTRRRANAARLAGLLADFRSLGLDPIVIDDSSPAAVLGRLTGWAEARLAQRRGAW